MIPLVVQCRSCERDATHEVGAILFDPGPVEDDPDDAEAWSRAVYVPLSLACPHCAAVDEFEVTVASGRAARDALGSDIVQEGRAALSDGTVIYTPSEGLRILRERADASPRRGPAWRALGNFAMRSGRADIALDAYARGAAIDTELECAIALAVSTVARGEPSAFDEVARAVSRLPLAKPNRRPLQAAHLAELLRTLSGRGEALIVHVGEEPIEVGSVRDWSRFGEQLAARDARSIRVERA